MNRRAFFRALGVGAAGIVAAPYLPALTTAFPAPVQSFGSRFIETGVFVPIAQKKIMARIRITAEALADRGVSEGAWRKFIHDEMAQTIYDVKTRSWDYWR